MEVQSVVTKQNQPGKTGLDVGMKIMIPSEQQNDNV